MPGATGSRFFQMKLIITTSFVLLFKLAFSQYKEVALTRDENKKGILHHYRTAGDYASSHLYILKDKKFRFENYSCLWNGYSEGTYQQTAMEIVFTSSLQKGTLPFVIKYRKRDSIDKYIKRIAFVQDMEGKEVRDAFVYINDDSTSCMDGDNFCTNEFGPIDSIKVVLSNGASSSWLKVKETEEIIQVRLQTKGDLSNYMIYNGRFRKKNKLLEELD